MRGGTVAPGSPVAPQVAFAADIPKLGRHGAARGAGAPRALAISDAAAAPQSGGVGVPASLVLELELERSGVARTRRCPLRRPAGSIGRRWTGASTRRVAGAVSRAGDAARSGSRLRLRSRSRVAGDLVAVPRGRCDGAGLVACFRLGRERPRESWCRARSWWSTARRAARRRRLPRSWRPFGPSPPRRSPRTRARSTGSSS